MKILHVISSVWRGGGGTSEVVPRLAREQKNLGHDVTIATARVGDVSDEAKNAFAAGVRNNAYPRLKLGYHLGISPIFAYEIKRLVADSDIVHLHGLWMFPPWTAGWAAQRLRKPYVMMPHGFLEPERLKISKIKKRIIGNLIERPLLQKANGIIATSESEAAGIRAYGVDKPIHIMPIGIDCERFDSGRHNDGLMRRLGLDSRKKHLLYFSRITPIKGLDMLAEAWGRVDHKDWQLVIVGPDDRGYSKVVSSLYAKFIADSSVVIYGPVFGQDKYDLLKSVDAFVLPTRSENWSIAVAEAMTSGLPVVCTKGAPWPCLNENGAGFWVDVNVDAIRDGVQKIVAMDDLARHDMGANGRKWVERHLGWCDIANSMVDYYRQVCKVK